MAEYIWDLVTGTLLMMWLNPESFILLNQTWKCSAVAINNSDCLID
jgi:hypothetical protein